MAGEWRFLNLPRPDGHHLRLARWTEAPEAPARGTALLLTGRNECLEKYAELAADWAERGFAVVAMDWRGQGGSSRHLTNPHKGHVPDFRLFLDDLEAALPVLLVDRAPGPVVAFAHSMGGHILLRYAAERGGPFAGLVVCAPMIGINTGPTPEKLLRWAAARQVAKGRGDTYTPGQGDWSPEAPIFTGNLLTSDPVRFLVGHNAYVTKPEVAMGGITWGWLDAAFRSIDALLAPGALERITQPVLMLTGGRDRIVRVDRQGEAAKRLTHGRQVMLADARHEVMMERDALRNVALAEIDRFLAEVLPPR